MYVLGLICLAALVFMIFWVPAELLHKAGYSRWYAPLMLCPGFIGLIIFAVVDWPVQRELAWLRLKTGDPAGADVALVEKYAVGLEKRGEWKKAIEVLENLARTAGEGDGAGEEYYRGWIKRLHERTVA
jgi:hypothetical protein